MTTERWYTDKDGSRHRCIPLTDEICDAAYLDGTAEMAAERAALIRRCEDTPEQADWDEADQEYDNERVWNHVCGNPEPCWEYPNCQHDDNED
jgi:hypothetical protein